MPIYEYRCQRCGVFEEIQRITDQPLERCPQCGRKVRRLISSTSFHLKGSGWYVTDYARAGSGNGRDKKDSSETKSGTSSASESSGESKSSTKSTTKSTTGTGTDSGGTTPKTTS